MQLLYDKEYRLVGARTDHFLLEKSRLVKVDPGERGYHIFYQVRRVSGHKKGSVTNKCNMS